MHIWHWQTRQNRTYLTCSLLDAWPHGFFDQSGYPALPEDLIQTLHPTASAFRVKQVHGNMVLTPTEIHDWQTAPLPPASDQSQSQSSDESATSSLASTGAKRFPDGDGIITEQAHQAAWVATADCIPALIADRQTGQVAAVHAGWRGTAAQILPHAIRRLQVQGSQLPDLRVALGPAIAGKVYQVSKTVAAEIGKTILASIRHCESTASTAATAADTTAPLASTAESDLLDGLAQMSPSPLMADPHPERVRIDIRRINALQLQQLGLEADQIAIAPYCTYQDADRFFSYRRDRQKKVQWSGIVSIAN